MIYVGTDIVSINKLDKLIKSKGEIFLNKIFTKKEQLYCNDKVNSIFHYGGKFAAKESIKKAILSSNIIPTLSFLNIEVLNNDNGSPFVLIKDIKIIYTQCQVSISHIDDYATAVAILIINDLPTV